MSDDSAEYVPYFSEEQIRYLERMFPDQSPKIEWSDRKIWSKSGAASVAKHLRRVQQEQEEEELTP